MTFLSEGGGLPRLPTTLQECEATYESHDWPYGWCRTCDKQLHITWGEKPRSFVYAMPEECEKHDYLFMAKA